MKKMKKNRIYSMTMMLIIACWSLNGCVKLEEDLTGQPTTDKFFKNVNDLKSYMAGAYTQLARDLYGTDIPFMAGAGAEDVHTNVQRWQGFEKANVATVANPDEITDNLWNVSYSSISTCNTLLSVISQSTLDVSLTTPIAGEAKFMRALNYFNLVRWFGEVPVLDEINQVNAATEPQKPVGEVYAFILKDLAEAETELPSSQPDRSKPNRIAASALLAKVYLAMAGFPLNQADQYARARDKAKEVIDARVYALENDFSRLWNFDYRFTNSEFIFTLYANSNNGTGTYLHRAIRPWDHDEGGWGDWESDKRFLANFPAGPRLDGTFYLTMRDGVDWTQTDYAQPYIGKYRDAGPKSGGYAGFPLANIADGFFPLIRYADILLVYAEAANLSEGNPSSAAYDAINLVRKRAGLLEISGLNSAQFDQAVLAERHWELAFEHSRWFDLCRRHLVKETVQSYYPDSPISDNNYLMPKPNSQLAIMKGIRQNPGY